MEELSLRLADLDFRFRWNSTSDVPRLLRERYAPFCSASADPSHHFGVSHSLLSQALPSDVTFRTEGKQIRVARTDLQSTFNSSIGEGQLDVAPNPYSFDSFLRIFVSWRLPQVGGLLLHAASVVSGGEGYVFPAVSGGGKSTLVSLSAEKEALTDELSPLRREADGYWLFGSPFWGQLACQGRPARVPLKGVYFLKKGAAPTVMALSRSEAMRRALGVVMNFDLSLPTVNNILREVENLMTAVPCFELTFSRLLPFWPTLTQERTAVA